MNVIGYFLLLLSVAVNHVLRRKFANYAQTRLQANLSGVEVATRMLDTYGIEDVKTTYSDGHLSDHYNSLTKTIHLSPQVYEGRNAAAVAIAAHECGHAVQHAQGYALLRMRSAMVPVLSFTTRFLPWIIMLGIFMVHTTLIPLKAGIALFALTTIFSFVTLPVELDASRRALAWIKDQGIVTNQELSMSKSALQWAAMTYVLAALGSLAQLLHLINVLKRNNK